MLQCLLGAVLTCSPVYFPWHLYVGHEKDGAIVWQRSNDSFSEPHECDAEAQHYPLAYCERDPFMT